MGLSEYLLRNALATEPGLDEDSLYGSQMYATDSSGRQYVRTPTDRRLRSKEADYDARTQSRQALRDAPWDYGKKTYSRAYNEGRPGFPTDFTEFPAPGGHVENRKKFERLLQLREERALREAQNNGVSIPMSPEEAELWRSTWWGKEGAWTRPASPEEIASGVAINYNPWDPSGDFSVRATPPPGWDYPGSDFQMSPGKYRTPPGLSYPDIEEPRDPFQPSTLFSPPPPAPPGKARSKSKGKAVRSRALPGPGYPIAKSKRRRKS